MTSIKTEMLYELEFFGFQRHWEEININCGSILTLSFSYYFIQQINISCIDLILIFEMLIKSILPLVCIFKSIYCTTMSIVV